MKRILNFLKEKLKYGEMKENRIFLEFRDNAKFKCATCKKMYDPTEYPGARSIGLCRLCEIELLDGEKAYLNEVNKRRKKIFLDACANDEELEDI